MALLLWTKKGGGALDYLDFLVYFILLFWLLFVDYADPPMTPSPALERNYTYALSSMGHAGQSARIPYLSKLDEIGTEAKLDEIERQK